MARPRVCAPEALVGLVAAAGRPAGEPLALVLGPEVLALAAADGVWTCPVPSRSTMAELVGELEARLRPRWVWWSAASTARPLVESGVTLSSCWDLAAVHRLVHGGSADAPARIWAAARGLDPDEAPTGPDRSPDGQLGLLDDDLTATAGQPDATEPDSWPLRADGHLRPECLAEVTDGQRAAQLAVVALTVHESQLSRLTEAFTQRHSDDTRRTAVGDPRTTARSESAAALLCVELEHDGLPVDRPEAERLISVLVGPRPAGDQGRAEQRRMRDSVVLQHVPGVSADLRNPAHVRDLLRQVGIDVSDTRSWRLEPFRGVHPVVEPLLAWRKAERIETTYGYTWLDRDVGPDGRLRGAWHSSDGAAGRMTAQAGLHNLPAELRSAVAAEPGQVFVRADLGQIEPRVLAAVSEDPGLVEATQAEDLYLPVAAQLGVDRPVAKVAVLAAMYGQTSGAAGQALRRMERAYPQALAALHAAELAGREGRPVTTYGGRRVPVWTLPDDTADLRAAQAARGRFTRNALIQGAAAELFKAWAVTVRHGLRETSGRIVLCLHDELLVQAPEESAERSAEIVRAALASTARFWFPGSRVRFVADVRTMRRWSEAKP
jgi:DNA polymerase-1